MICEIGYDYFDEKLLIELIINCILILDQYNYFFDLYDRFL